MMTIIATILIVAATPELLRLTFVLFGLIPVVEPVRPVGQKCGK